MRIHRFHLLLFFCFSLSFAQGWAQTDLGEQLKQVISGKAATVGVAVIFNGSELVTVNNMYRYPMMSTFKFHQALSVMEYINRKGEDLATEILVKRSDLKENTYSPMRDANPNGNFRMTIGDLLKYSLIESDNNACDVLFKHIGGPKFTQRYVHELGIQDVAITQTEAMMHESPDNCTLNWTKPSAAVLLMETFLQNELCSKQQKVFIQRAMADANTGKDKLKAGLPKDVLLAHKTGSSDRNEFDIKLSDNDMGFVVLPNGQYYTIAVFIMNSQESDKVNARLIADISRTVYTYFIDNYKK